MRRRGIVGVVVTELKVDEVEREGLEDFLGMVMTGRAARRGEARLRDGRV